LCVLSVFMSAQLGVGSLLSLSLPPTVSDAFYEIVYGDPHSFYKIARLYVSTMSHADLLSVIYEADRIRHV
jgi:hypothetical protein